jgi:chemotaxis protein MotB
MAGQGNVAPIIIKRKKVIQGGGHHGGAWKVAYADFVTAMMAFFMLMWLLNATTEKQRKGIADYFNPTIPMSRVSGGGDGAFGGDSIFSEDAMTQSGTGEPNGDPNADTTATADSSTAAAAAKAAKEAAKEAAEKAAEQKALEQLSESLKAKGGESMTMERLMRHVVTRVTDEGLVIEMFDLLDAPLFVGETAEPTENTQQIMALLVEVMALATNRVAINSFVKSYPITLMTDPTWELTTARAQSVRLMLEGDQLDPKRIARVTGHADREPVTADPSAIRNNRIEVVLLRKDR